MQQQRRLIGVLIVAMLVVAVGWWGILGGGPQALGNNGRTVLIADEMAPDKQAPDAGGEAGRERDPLSRPQVQAALLLSPSEAVPIAAQRDLFEQLAPRIGDGAVLSARLRVVPGSQVAYVEVFTNPFRIRGAREIEREELVSRAATLLREWFTALDALGHAAAELPDAQARSIRPVLVRDLHDGTAIADAMNAEPPTAEPGEANDEAANDGDGSGNGNGNGDSQGEGE